MSPLIPHDCILKLHTVAVTVGLEREALLTGMEPDFVASLPRAKSSGAQLLLDLDRLNRVKLLLGGQVPLRVWLLNAIQLLGSRCETDVVQSVLVGHFKKA